MFDGELHPKSEWADVVIGLYYGHLNADPDFQADLAALFERLADPIRQLERLARLTRNNPQYHQPYPFRAYDVPQGEHADLDYWRVYNAVGQALSDFCVRWHLPTEYGLHDLWYSLGWRVWAVDHDAPHTLRLEVGIRGRWQPTVGSSVIIDVLESGSERVVVSMKLPWIFPNAPVPFMYDPTEQSRAWLNERIDAICENIRQSILNQAEALEAQAQAEGWDKRPRRFTGEYLRDIARALYLRAVRGMRWEQIASERGRYDYKSYARRVREFARLCGIPLME